MDVGSGTKDENYQGIDLRGKVALASGYAANVVRQAVLKHGAVGVVIYPDAADRPDHPDMVRFTMQPCLRYLSLRALIIDTCWERYVPE